MAQRVDQTRYRIDDGTAIEPLSIKHPNAAGVDIGGGSHYVGVPSDRVDKGERAVREFGPHTEDLVALADWLVACRIDTVALESTGVYWIPLYELLQARGFDVWLVDAKSVRHVKARKSDVLDCQWLQQLHSFGLLCRAHRPDGQVCALRACLMIAFASDSNAIGKIIFGILGFWLLWVGIKPWGNGQGLSAEQINRMASRANDR